MDEASGALPDSSVLSLEAGAGPVVLWHEEVGACVPKAEAPEGFTPGVFFFLGFDRG